MFNRNKDSISLGVVQFDVLRLRAVAPKHVIGLAEAARMRMSLHVWFGLVLAACGPSPLLFDAAPGGDAPTNGDPDGGAGGGSDAAAPPLQTLTARREELYSAGRRNGGTGAPRGE